MGDARPAALFENRSLFSDHYLRDRLPDQPSWGEKVDAAWERLCALYQRERGSLEGMNEAQTEERWVKPLLRDILGWDFQVQADVRGPSGRINRPDYVLFLDEGDRRAAITARDSERGFYARAAAIAEAKFWGRPLDRKVTREVRDITNANPSFQIVAYLVASGVQWGILTNGREWRLYSGQARSRIDTYYSVDLQRLLEEGDRESFRYFLFFFRAAGFRRDALTGRSFLDSVLEGSETYARELERRLKDLIFDEIFPYLARGFATWRRESGVPAEDDESLRDIYTGTLRLLYRLLFVLYAEARGLLPTGRYSLTEIKRRVAEARDRRERLSEVSDDFWNDLAGLFRRVDRGDPGTGMPRYNGGLFREDAPRNRFLREQRMADAFLAPALDLLARAGGEQFIDYKALSVEQLGSVYEGLLEFRLRLDDRGAPYLVNDKGERKATGSYYTPQYVVEYIVGEAVGPVLEERIGRFREIMEEVEPLRGRVLRAQAGGRERNGVETLRSDLRRLEAEAVEALLGIRICDPAMGSGHFLVHATDWLTERLMVVLNEYPENPVLARIAQVRAQIVQNLEEQGISVDPEHLKDTNLLKRMVMKQCIYGVDLNAMATELAKLALWLDSFTVGAPLSFLDHHLKTGNSLVGTRVGDLRRDLETGESPQFDAFGGPFAGMLLATAMMREVAALTDATFEEVALSSRCFAEYEDQINPYKQLLNVWLARSFAAEHKELRERAELMVRLYADQVLDAARGKQTKLKPYHLKALAAAAEVAQDEAFFHWELEFPEVFVDLERAQWKENPGFDAVIGNPPYVRQEKLSRLKDYLQQGFASYHGSADLYLFFYELGIRILRDGGRLGFISSGTFARANFAAGFRKALPRLAHADSLVDFGENQPFAGAEMVRPSILTLRKGGEPAPFRVLLIDGGIPASLADGMRERGFDCDPASLRQPEWTFQGAGQTRLFRKIMGVGSPLAHFVGGRLYYGIKTGLNEAFIIDRRVRDELVQEHPGSEELLRRLVQGEDLRPWYQEEEGRWLILVPNGWTRATLRSGTSERVAWELFQASYPAVARHLEPHAERGRKRSDKGQFWWELRSCDYYDAFDKAKVFWPDIAKLPRFSQGDPGVYLGNTGYVIPEPHPGLLGVLQSRVTWFAISQICQPLRLRAGLWQYRLLPQFVSRLPIPELDTPAGVMIGNLAMNATTRARARYDLHRRARGRIATDLGAGTPVFSRRLNAWWDLDFNAFRTEVRKSLRVEIPLRERDEWEEWHRAQAAAHEELTAEIARLEAELNDRVYDLFGLNAEERRVVEETTKYPYGVV